jgi:hypothetical protein
MPQFSVHAPKASSTLRKEIKLNSFSLEMQSKPIGTIGESINFSYLYDGDTYRVTVGFFKYYALGRSKMTFEQAKSLYNACIFANIDPVEFDFDKAKRAFKEIKKSSLKGDNLMFLWIDLLS